MIPDFEYSERGKRVVNRARQEAGKLGCARIESEHLLLGLSLEDWDLVHHLLSRQESPQSIRDKIISQTPAENQIPDLANMPFSHECQQVLEYAHQEAIRRNQAKIDSEHLLMGILHVEGNRAAAILGGSNVCISMAETTIESSRPEEQPIREIVTDVANAWDMRDPRAFSSFFDDNGEFTDTHGELWVGRPDIATGAKALLETLPRYGSGGRLDSLRFVDKDVVATSIVWERDESTARQRSGKSSMTLVLCRRKGIWNVIKAYGPIFNS